MDTYKTKNTMSFEEASQQNWYFSVRPASKKQILTVKFDGRKKYQYIGSERVNIGDPVIIDFGGATSYNMGNVSTAEEGVRGKQNHKLNTLFSFSIDPGKADLKKNAEGILCLQSASEAGKYLLGYAYSAGRFRVIDYLIKGVLNAITVIAYPKLSSEEDVFSAKTFLTEEKLVPAFLFGKEFTDRYYSYNYNLEDYLEDQEIEEDFFQKAVNGMIPEAEVVLSGHYPGWQEQVDACQFWNDPEAHIIRFWDPNQKICQMFFYDPSKQKEAYFEESEEFRTLTNELVYRSALSILIRGGFTNLLKAALSVELPIHGFKDKLIQFADEIGSLECGNVLRGVEAPATSEKKEKGKKTTGKKPVRKDRKGNFTYQDYGKEKKSKPYIISEIDGEDYLGDVKLSSLDHVLTKTGKNLYRIAFSAPGFSKLNETGYKGDRIELDIDRQLNNWMTVLEYSTYSPITEELIANKKALNQYIKNAVEKVPPKDRYKVTENAMRKWPKGVQPYQGSFSREQSLGLILQFCNQICSLTEEDIRTGLESFPTMEGDPEKVLPGVTGYQILKGTFFMAKPLYTAPQKPKVKDLVHTFRDGGFPTLVVESTRAYEIMRFYIQTTPLDEEN